MFLIIYVLNFGDFGDAPLFSPFGDFGYSPIFGDFGDLWYSLSQIGEVQNFPNSELRIPNLS